MGNFWATISFHLSLLWQGACLLWNGTERLVTTMGILAFCAAFFFKREIAELFGKAAAGYWGQGPSRWWALLPIGLYVMLGMMRANFQRYDGVRAHYDSEKLARESLVKELAEERRRNRPALALQGLQVGVGNSESNEAVAFLIAAVSNTGAPSIADGWALTATVSGSREVQGEPQFINPTGNINLAFAGGDTRTYSPDDALYNKTAVPIQNGGKVPGILIFAFPGANVEDLRKPDTRFELSCTDVAGVRVRADLPWQGGQPSDIRVYYPGMKPPGN